MLTLALEVFRPVPSPPIFTSGSSSLRLGPSTETPLDAAPIPQQPTNRSMLLRSSSHEVLPPFSETRSSESASATVPPVTPSLPGLSQTLEGLILATPCGLVSYRCRSWGLLPSGYSPPTKPVQARHLGDPLSMLAACSEEPPAHPQGVASRESPCTENGVLHPIPGRDPPGLFRLHGSS